VLLKEWCFMKCRSLISSRKLDKYETRICENRVWTRFNLAI
jgi:hypothetical protein